MKDPHSFRWDMRNSPSADITRYLCELPKDGVKGRVFWPSHRGYGYNLEDATYPASLDVTWEPLK